MFQTPFSDKIRNEARLATMAVGNIYEPDHANSILAAGRADLVALGRPHLIDPMWTLRAAAALDYRDIHVPPQYLNGQAQLARNLKREAEAAAALQLTRVGFGDQCFPFSNRNRRYINHWISCRTYYVPCDMNKPEAISCAPACRGRPREFCVDQALAKALRVFWEKGYDGTSLNDLTEAMGITRPSLYAAFGNKESLFRKALDLYETEKLAYIRRGARTADGARRGGDHASRFGRQCHERKLRRAAWLHGRDHVRRLRARDRSRFARKS